MLIRKISEVRTALVYHRLFMTARYGLVKGKIMEYVIYQRLIPITIAETQLAYIQAQLSMLCSLSCSYLVCYYDNGTNHQEWQADLKKLIQELNFPGQLIDLIDKQPRIEDTDLRYHRDPAEVRKLQAMLLPLLQQKEFNDLEHYIGSRITDTFPNVTGSELAGFFDAISETNVADPEQIQRLIDIIGKKDSWSWRNAAGVIFMKGRLQ